MSKIYKYSIVGSVPEQCPLCNSSISHAKSFHAPLKIVMCNSKKCDFATWNIKTPVKKQVVYELEESEFVKWRKSKGYEKRSNMKRGYWVYVLRNTYAEKRKQTYYIGHTVRLPIYRLLEHSLNDHDKNSKKFRMSLKRGESPCLIETIGPFNNRIEAYLFESLMYNVYCENYKSSLVYGDGGSNMKGVDLVEYMSKVKKKIGSRNDSLKIELQNFLEPLIGYIGQSD